MTGYGACCYSEGNFSSSNDQCLNQICAKVSVESIHVNFNGGNWVRAQIQADVVTTLQVEHPACVHGTDVRDCSLHWRLSEELEL